jgi:hypothetical protein
MIKTKKKGEEKKKHEKNENEKEKTQEGKEHENGDDEHCTVEKIRERGAVFPPHGKKNSERNDQTRAHESGEDERQIQGRNDGGEYQEKKYAPGTPDEGKEGGSDDNRIKSQEKKKHQGKGPENTFQSDVGKQEEKGGKEKNEKNEKTNQKKNRSQRKGEKQ